MSEGPEEVYAAIKELEALHIKKESKEILAHLSRYRLSFKLMTLGWSPLPYCDYMWDTFKKWIGVNKIPSIISTDEPHVLIMLQWSGTTSMCNAITALCASEGKRSDYLHFLDDSNRLMVPLKSAIIIDLKSKTDTPISKQIKAGLDELSHQSNGILWICKVSYPRDLYGEDYISSMITEAPKSDHEALIQLMQ